MREHQLDYLKTASNNKYAAVLNNAKEMAKFQEYKVALAAMKQEEENKAIAAEEYYRENVR